MKDNKRKQKSSTIKLLEYSAVYLIVSIVKITPLKAARSISNLLAYLYFLFVPSRQHLAFDNIKHALNKEKNDNEIKEIARQSCSSLFFTFLETIKLNHLFSKKNPAHSKHPLLSQFSTNFYNAKRVQTEAGKCVFVTPHIGNWEALSYAFSESRIPICVIARPLNNKYVEKLIYANRSSRDEMVIPKKNSLFILQKTLREGKSIGMLPDQSTMKGLLIDFFGRKATTTPVPAMLALKNNVPIVVVACCRKKEDFQYELFVSDPVWPGQYSNKKDELIRITEEMTRRMESIIRKYPEQYLWTHNRWKKYRNKKEFMSTAN